MAPGYHFHIRVISHGQERKRGRKASAMSFAAYAAGERLKNEFTGELTRDYSNRLDVEAAFILAPRGSPDWVYDRSKLWSRAEAAETRKNSILARNINVAFPRELSRDDRLSVLKEFVQIGFIARGMVADCAIHNDMQETNPHAHISLTTRLLNGSGFHSHKERSWNNHDLATEWRGLFSALCSKALYGAGYQQTALAYFFSHLTLDNQRQIALARGDTRLAQELDHKPGSHDGPRGHSARRHLKAQKDFRSCGVSLKFGFPLEDKLRTQARGTLQRVWNLGHKPDVFIKSAQKCGYALVRGDRRDFCLVRVEESASTFYCHNVTSFLNQTGRKVCVDDLRSFFGSSEHEIPDLGSWLNHRGFSAAATELVRRPPRRLRYKQRKKNKEGNVHGKRSYRTKDIVSDYIKLCRDPLHNLSGWHDGHKTQRTSFGLLSARPRMGISGGDCNFGGVRQIRGTRFKPLAPFAARYISRNGEMISSASDALHAFLSGSLTWTELKRWDVQAFKDHAGVGFLSARRQVSSIARQDAANIASVPQEFSCARALFALKTRLRPTGKWSDEARSDWEAWGKNNPERFRRIWEVLSPMMFSL